MASTALRELFVSNLKSFRKKEGFSQEILAHRCETAPNYIGQIESGRRFPSVEMIERIAAALKVEPYRLFKEEEPEEDRRETREVLLALPGRVKKDIAAAILAVVSAGVDRTLNPSRDPLIT